MSTTDTTAAQVMAASAALLNDAAQSEYNDVVCLPYLKIACDELQEQCQLFNIPSTNETSAVISVNSGVNRVTSVDDPTAGIPHYPYDLVEIQQLWERLANIEDQFIPMTKFEFIPHQWEFSPPIEQLLAWAWINQEIRFSNAGSNQNNEIKIDYIKTLFPQPITSNTVLGIINSKTFLSYRTAALLSSFSGENPSRAEELNMNAALAMDRLLGVGVKGKQSITTRRRPFMASYKSRMRGW